MKRFYALAEAVSVDGGWGISLDGKPVRTPARALLVVPTEALGAAIAGEWAAQGEMIAPRSMPLTGLANAAIDRAGPHRAAFVVELAAYAETDLLCYRAQEPDDLAARQAAAWDPLLDWAARRYDVAFTVTQGVMHRPQPAATVARLGAALGARDDFALVPMQPLITISGSLVIALALAEGAIDVEAAWTAAQVDETYQTEHWGDDELAAQARAARRADFDAAARFLGLRAYPLVEA